MHSWESIYTLCLILYTLYSDYKSFSDELHDKDGSSIIYQKNVECLAVESFKYLHGLSAKLLGEVYRINETVPYDSRMRNELYARNAKTW